MPAVAASLRPATTLILLSLLLAPLGLAAAAGPVVILKLDDCRGTPDPATAVSASWQTVVDQLAARGLVASFGISGKDLAAADEGFLAWCRELHAAGRIEFWNHGYTHGKRTIDGQQVPEFADSIEQQREAFQRTQRLAVETLGFPFRAFGSPFNALTADTPRVLAEDPDLRVWLYGKPELAQAAGFGGIVLGRSMNIEQPVTKANAEHFIASYAKREALPPYLCLQGHPGNWSRQQLIDFERILDFLLEQGSRFATPSGYAAELAAASPTGAER